MEFSSVYDILTKTYCLVNSMLKMDFFLCGWCILFIFAT